MFLGQIEKMDWQMECDASVPYRAMTVQVGFSHAENEMDETEFCINAYDAKELTELFEGFCKENGFEDVSVESISVVRVAATLDELTKMEEMEAYQKEDSVVSKEIADMDLVQKWKDIYSKEDQTMIALLECEEARELFKADKEELLLWSGDDEYAYVDEKGTLIYKENGNGQFQPETWDDMKKKYPMSRAEMDEETEMRFVEDCFHLYEKEGFSSVFWSPYTDYEDRKGQKIEVVGRCSTENIDLCVLPMWKIRFPDGKVLEAGSEEVIPSEMRANGCKLFDEKKVTIDGLIEEAKGQQMSVSMQDKKKSKREMSL